jgi:hypothetical protein
MKLDTQQEARRIVTSFAIVEGPWESVSIAIIKGFGCDHGGGGSIQQDGTLHSHQG